MKSILLLVVALLLMPVLAEAQSVQHNLSWTDPNSGTSQEVTTRVEQKINAGVYAEVGFVGPDVVAFSVTTTNPFPGQHTMCYRVRAVNTAGDALSPEACIQTPIVTPIKPVPPGQPIIQQIILP